MSDIDLIPSDYRHGLWLRSASERFVTALSLVLLVSVLVDLGLKRTTAGIRGDIEALQARQAITVQQRDRVNQLDERKQWDQRQWGLLNGLRGGVEAQAMFVAIDRALVGDQIWFTRWEFQRAGSVVEHKDETVNTGYFVVLPRKNNEPSTEVWKIETHMSIHGEAYDYSALSGFVSRLLAQPEIQSVHVQNTATRSRGERQTVEFTLAILVNTGGGDR
jgi:Fimbrial assembly protein (PilN)